MAVPPAFRRLLDHPVLGPVVHVARRARTLLQQRRAARTPWMRHKQLTDRAFDAAHGIDTGGIVPTYAMGVQSCESLQHAVEYIASDPSEFERAVSDLSIEHERFTFIDIGCGKGRALMLAAKLPFKRLVGVELSPKLVTTARENLKRVLTCKRAVDVHCHDALQLELPNEPLVLFMYNPFGREPMQKLASKVQAWRARSDHELFVVYTNPFHADVWADAGFREVARGDVHVIFAPAAAEHAVTDGLGSSIKRKLSALVGIVSEPFTAAVDAYAEGFAQLSALL